jgi:signal transduction histidine kinase
MLELVRNLLDVNRLESGTVQFHPVEFDLAPMAESTVWQYTQTASVKHITLHYRLETDVSMVYADEQATMQVLENLVSNAVKYSPHGKQVFIRISSKDDYVRLEVEDEGPGLSDEDKSKLFSKFARLSARPTGGEYSTGLGLSIVKKMVVAMNGKVWCESEYGKGATFIVELPSPSSSTLFHP